ncbi:MAG: heparinase II/III family protein [Lentisphaerae bacterium]|nr:heparinase II/III family protein [Lentisphaerota bacterium]
MNFNFGAAKKLYARGEHPRIYFGRQDLPKLRRQLRLADGRKIADAFRKDAREWVRKILAIEPQALPQALKQAAKPGYAGIHAAFNMAILAVLDEDCSALEATRRVLAAAPAAEEDPSPDGQARHRLGRTAVSPAEAYDLIQPQLSAQERRAFCTWLYNSGIKRTLDDLLPRYFLWAGMNIPLGGLRNAIAMLLAIDGEEGVGNLKKEWARALPMLEATLNTIMGPNGYPEEDMGYGTSVVAGIARVVEALRRAGIYDVYKQCPRYARFGNAILHLVQPWGEHLSTTGDHGDDFGSRTFVLARQAEETGNPALLWLQGTLCYPSFPPINDIVLRPGVRVEKSIFSLLLAHKFRKGVHPARLKPQPATQFCDEQRGIVTFRSSWDKDATFVVFDGSQRNPAAQGHEHASCGHFSISALGEYFGIDTGRYNMEQNCHSVVLIDGKSGRSTDGEWVSVRHGGILRSYCPGEFVDTAVVDSSLQHNCYWARRQIGLVKGVQTPAYLWVVDDINKNNAWAEYWWQLHTCPENKIELFASHATITGWRHGHKLDVHFALPGKAEYDPPHKFVGLFEDQVSPSSYKYVGPFKQKNIERLGRPANQVHYSTFQRPRLLARIAGLNGRFMAVLLPRARNMAPAKVRRLECLPASLAVRLDLGAVADTIIYAHEHGVLEADGVSARGRWCVVRRDSRSGRVLDYAVGEGTHLAVNGRVLSCPH